MYEINKGLASSRNIHGMKTTEDFSSHENETLRDFNSVWQKLSSVITCRGQIMNGTKTGLTEQIRN